MKSWIALSLIILMSTLVAAAPYDEKADAQAAVNHAIAEAKKSNKSVLLVFGANWCADCLALDKALKTEKNADLSLAVARIIDEGERCCPRRW